MSDERTLQQPAMPTASSGVRIAMRVSVVVGIAILGIKIVAWLMTGSATVLSDALESVVHVGATLFVAWCARIADAPPDADHPYGHGRVEFLSAGFEGGAVGFAALGIAGVAIESWLSDRSLGHLDIGLLLVLVASVINALLGWWLLQQGRKWQSPLLVADAHHVLSDVWTSLGVLLGVCVLWIIPDPHVRRVVDALIALALAGYVLVVAARLIRSAIAGLMDEADPQLIERIVNALTRLRRSGWLDVHGLRVRRAGRAIHADLHLVLPRTWSVEQAHDEAEHLEHGLLRELGVPGSVMVHLDHDGGPAYRTLPEGGLPITRERATRQE